MMLSVTKTTAKKQQQQQQQQQQKTPVNDGGEKSQELINDGTGK